MFFFRAKSGFWPQPTRHVFVLMLHLFWIFLVFIWKKMASCWPMALFSRRSAVNYRAFANDITKCEVCTYILSHIGVPHAPSISLCLSCKIHLFTSNPLCGADLSHPTCAAYLLSLLHNEWLSGALTVQRHHVGPVLKNWEYIPKTGACCVYIS